MVRLFTGERERSSVYRDLDPMHGAFYSTFSTFIFSKAISLLKSNVKITELLIDVPETFISLDVISCANVKAWQDKSHFSSEH